MIFKFITYPSFQNHLGRKGMFSSMNRLRELQVQCIYIMVKTKDYTINQKQVHLITKRLHISSGNKNLENL